MPLRQPRALPSQDTLLALFDYRPETGFLYWRRRCGEDQATKAFNSTQIGKRALGTPNVDGYPEGRLLGLRHIRAHRVIWKMIHGSEPMEIDHVNGDRTDNRITNLREASRSQNQRNRAFGSISKSGTAGVYWRESTRRFHVVICKKYVGVYRTLDDAVAARKAAEKRLGFEPRHGTPSQKWGQAARVGKE